MATETTTNLSATLSPDMAALSPAMRQYRAAKDTYPDTLLFFRMGDFYELFFEDAVVAARELQLTLTARDKARSVPMCGVPYHAAQNYISRLIQKGYRVAICDWDLEAPGLERYVLPNVTREEDRRVFDELIAANGLIDLLLDYKATLSSPEGATGSESGRPPGWCR